MLAQLYDALKAGNVPDKARAAAEEEANYEGELTRLRLEIAERFKATDELISRLEAEVSPPQVDDGLRTRLARREFLSGVPLHQAAMTDAITFTLDRPTPG